MQWVRDPSQINVDNLNIVSREASRFQGKENYLKVLIEEIEKRVR